MIRAFIRFFCLSIILVQPAPSAYAQRCVIEPGRDGDTTAKDVNALIQQCGNIPGAHFLNKHLREIKGVLNQWQSPVEICLSDGIEDAIAIADNRQQRWVIAINEKFYSSKVKRKYQEALFIWIIGHEITHHINADDFYEQSGKLRNYAQELLADENGGYVLGKLTSEITLDDVEQILSKTFKNHDTSWFYPKLKYRILAAKAGWLRAKAEKLEYNKIYLVSGSKIYKEGILKEDPDAAYRVFVVNDADSQEMTRFENHATGRVQFGYGHKNGELHGECVLMYFWEDQPIPSYMDLGRNDFYYLAQVNGEFHRITKDWEFTGSIRNDVKEKGVLVYWNNDTLRRYEGEFKKGKFSGHGVGHYTDGSVYSGDWLENKRNGRGVLRTRDKVIHSGYWKDNVFIGKQHE